VGRPVHGRRAGTAALVLYGALKRAVRLESEAAVIYWWGVGADTVWKWRKALGVGRTTSGTSALRGRIMLGEQGRRKRELSRAKDRDPGRCERIAAARRGRPRPPHVVEAMRRGNLGRVPTEEQRRKMSEAAKRRGAWPPAAGRPWTETEDELVRSLPAAEAAKLLTGRTLRTVYGRRHTLRLPDGRRKENRG
jgi:hypothetical protein